MLILLLPPAYLGLFVDLGRVSPLEAQPALSALSGQALTPAGLGTALRPRIHKRHWTEGLARGEIQHQARPHSRQTCLAVQLERIL